MQPSREHVIISSSLNPLTAEQGGSDSNRRCEMPNTEIKETIKCEFDYVIVGAGPSAMGLVLGLLTKMTTRTPPFTIVVIDRGSGPPHSTKTKNLSDWPDAATIQSTSSTILKTTIGDYIVDIPIGRGLGGTTNINAGLCTPPAAVDFEIWPEPWKGSMMNSVKSVLDIMFENGALAFQRNSIPPFLSIRESNTDLRDEPTGLLWTEAVYPQLITNLQFAAKKTKGGKFIRKNYYEALIEPLLKTNSHFNDYISWFKLTEVQRILFQDHLATGVECYSLAEGMFQVTARREVIICAGAFESPALLLVSGLGRDDDLEKASIEPHMMGSKMGVGRNLRDHLIVPKAILVPWLFYMQSPNTVQALMQFSSGEDRFQMALNDSTCFTQLIPYILASKVRRNPSLASPDLMEVLFSIVRFVLRLVLTYSPLYLLFRHCTFVINIILMNPKSKGRIWLKRKTPHSSKPTRRMDMVINVDSCYFSDSRDIKALEKGWNICHERCNTWFKQGIEVFPGQAIRRGYGDDWFRKFTAFTSLPYYHWCGTCSIESHEREDWVVDSHLKVRGLLGLRVCDASVFPSTVTGPTAITCAALGYEFASILLSHKKKKTL